MMFNWTINKPFDNHNTCIPIIYSRELSIAQRLFALTQENKTNIKRLSKSTPDIYIP